MRTYCVPCPQPASGWEWTANAGDAKRESITRVYWQPAHSAPLTMLKVPGPSLGEVSEQRDGLVHPVLLREEITHQLSWRSADFVGFQCTHPWGGGGLCRLGDLLGSLARPKNIEGPTAERVAALSTTLKEERVAGTTNAWHLGTAAPSPEQPVRVRYGNNTDLTAGSHADVNGNVHARMSHVTASTTMRKTRIMNVGSEEKESARKAQDSSTPESPGPFEQQQQQLYPIRKSLG